MTVTQHLHVGSRPFKAVVYPEAGYAVVRLEWSGESDEHHEMCDVVLFPHSDVVADYATEFMRVAEALRAIVKHCDADVANEDAA